MEPEFVTEADWIPTFWTFLLNLNCSDLIAELIQNDLDQGATRTVISFERNRLVCEGDGSPVDSEGWQRLRKIQGAGDTVPAKRGKIGVKNHGLKTAFTIGDDIRVLSDGQAITQTLYARGSRNTPHPGASPEPKPDPQSPLGGCRIVIRYRKRDFNIRNGEAIHFQPVGKQDIDLLFKSACATMPDQFAGIVSSPMIPRYEITLRHWELGEANFVFSCTRLRKAKREIEIFRRRCKIYGTMSELPTNVLEEAARRWLPLKGQIKKRVPDFYRHGNRFFVEVSWPIDRSGKPKIGTGRFRYPIGYPEGSQEANTGHGVHFNAPVVSDTERHGPAQNEATYADLREACEKLLVDALAHHVIPRWGPYGLNPLVPNPKSNNQDEAVRPLLAKLASRSAVPTIEWQEVVNRTLKSKNKETAKERSELNRRRSREPKRYRFVIPVVPWNCKIIHTSLSLICPRSERQIDPWVHHEIINLFIDGKTKGFCEDFITFDQNDAINRATGEENKRFAPCRTPVREFSHPIMARAYLDIINESIKNGELNEKKQIGLRKTLLLPDINRKPSQFENLYAGANLPADIPSLNFPSILHRDLISHPLFRKMRWQIGKYTMATFLDSGTLQTANEQTRRLFWEWLRHNEHNIGSRERTKLVGIPIWPDTVHNLYMLSDLCYPRLQHITRILGSSIRQPHDHVRRLKMVTSGKRYKTPIRRIPSSAEIDNWLEKHLKPFVVGDMSNTDTSAALERLESDLAVLMKDGDISCMLQAKKIALPCLAQDDSIRLRRELVTRTTNIERLALLPRFMLKRNRWATTLDKVSAPLSEPTIEMLVSTFDEDCANFSALGARLRLFVALTRHSLSERLQLAGKPILPVQGRARAPRDLALKGRKGDFWGDWKISIPVKGLSQDDQKRYLDIGVTSSSPIYETSREFFKWLARQDATIIGQHIICVFRHILHPNGPTNWAEIYADVPCIPVENCDGLRIISLQDARQLPVYIPDTITALGKDILERDRGVFLVINRIKEISDPISESLQKFGLKSLRNEIIEPVRVDGEDNIQVASHSFLDGLRRLKDRSFKKTFLKRLDELDVEKNLIRQDWHSKLSEVKEIRLADTVKACYRFRRKSYRVPVEAGFDHASSVFWIKRGSEDRFYETIAKQLVFKTETRRIELLALEKALTLEIDDPSFSKTNTVTGNWENDKTEQDEEVGINNSDSEPGEAIFGHSPFTPDPGRNIPNPRPIPSTPIFTSQSRSSTDGGNGNDDLKDREPTPGIEKQHITSVPTITRIKSIGYGN